MKKMIVRIFCTTGITLVVLAFCGGLSGARFLCINSVLESFAANILIHVGFLFTRRFESHYAILEFMIDLGYTIAVLFVFGILFHWFYSTPVWILLLIAVVVYTAGIMLNIFRIRQDIEEINVLLSKRNHDA